MGAMLDTIVVGGGPAGLYCALLLAESGFDVAVLEEHDTLGIPTHCTGVVSDELSDLFKVPESLILSRPKTCVVMSPSRRRVPLSSGEEGIAVIDRGELDRELGDAAERAGVQITCGVRVAEVRSEPACVRVLGSNGAALSARTCVIACGVRYGLQRQLGLGLPTVFLHSAQVEVETDVPDSDVEVHLGRGIAPEGFAWVVPVLRGGRTAAKVGIMMRGDAVSHLRRFLSGRGPAGRASAPEPTRRLLPLGPASPTYGHRVLSVGDAAGLTKPTTGGGIFYSLFSGRLAAETLIGALRDDRLSRGDLCAYEARWQAALGPHLLISSHFRRLFAKLTDREIETLLGALVSDDVQRVICQTARFNWHGELLRAVLRHPGVKSVLLHSLLR
jgi:digeranylgeranylglycerophospholipid reductase